MKKYDIEILNKLIDKYESSKSFTGTNTVKQQFSIRLESVFPEYADDARVSEIRAINEAVDSLEASGLAIGRKRKNGLRDTVQLRLDSLQACYAYLKRIPKKDTNARLERLLRDYGRGDDIAGVFCRKQLERLEGNRKPEHFKGSVDDYRDMLDALSAITKVEQETYTRDFSIQVFGDSKRFDQLKNAVVSVLYEYGDFPQKETVLEDLNIVKNPGHVYFKGNGIIRLAGQEIELDKLGGDIALSTRALKHLDAVTLTGNSVVTIENLTTFNACQPCGQFLIYLGGYHNSIRRAFIQKVYEQNADAAYYHFGDIDAGGFYILLHLREKTGVPFQAMHMDVNTLIQNRQYTRPLSDNDRKRLAQLRRSESAAEFAEVIGYMLENNCKLEQEALDIQ